MSVSQQEKMINQVLKFISKHQMHKKINNYNNPIPMMIRKFLWIFHWTVHHNRSDNIMLKI